jgi:mannose-6-phosphate isomerase-like protein (cupin superfamily)
MPAEAPLMSDDSRWVEQVVLEGIVWATIVRNEFREPGIHFFTPSNFSQQLGFMSHPAGHRIRAHVHREVSREVRRTQEALFVRSGVLRVDFYDAQGTRLESRTLRSGDVILLASGGHGFEVLEDCEFVEVKQGPYLGDEDKILLPEPRTRA